MNKFNTDNLSEGQIKAFNGMKNRIKELKKERDSYKDAVYEVLCVLYTLPVFVSSVEWSVNAGSITREDADLMIISRLSLCDEVLKGMKKHINIYENTELNKLIDKYVRR